MIIEFAKKIIINIEGLNLAIWPLPPEDQMTQNKTTELEDYKEFLAQPCQLCKTTHSMIDQGNFKAVCSHCKAGFMFAKNPKDLNARIEADIKKTKEAKQKIQENAQKRREFVEHVTNQFINEVPSSDILFDVCALIVAKLINKDNKGMKPVEVQARVNDFSDIVGSESFKIYHANQRKENERNT